MKRLKTLFTFYVFLYTTSFSFAQSNPNVLMIVLDDLNDYIGVLEGHPQTKTPNIDALANQGVLFTNAHSNAGYCKPSRTSFLSGILPSTSRYYGNPSSGNWNDNDILSNSKHISEYFSENGYTTYKTGKVEHGSGGEDLRWDIILSESLNYGPFAYNGNETVIHPQTVLAYADNTGPLDGTLARLSEIPEVLADDTNPGYTGWWSNGAPFSYTDDDNRDAMPDEASVSWAQDHITTLDTNNSTDPFFMAVGIVRPHSPFVVPDKYYEMFPIEDVQIPVIRRNDRDDTYFENGTTGYELFAALDDSYTDRQLGLRKKTQAYLACVAFADDMVGQLIETLDNSEYADNTMVMLFSDHGYHVGEKQYLRKNAVWEEATKVPLIIRHPDYSATAGETVDHPVSLIDLYPTLKDLCNLTGDTKKNSTGAELDGHSLKPFLVDPNSTTWTGPPIALSSATIWGTNNPDDQNYAVRSKKYRYIKYPSGEEELYHHTLDPYEWKNLENEADYSEVKTALEAALEEALVSDDTVLITVIDDEMIDDSKMLSMSTNWNFTTINTGDLIYDPEQIQRTDLSDGEVIYDATNVDTFRVDFWGIKDLTTNEYGTIKTFISTDNVTYNEITLNSVESNYTEYRRLFYYTPDSYLPDGTAYLKIVLTGGDQSWKGLIGAVELFDEQPFTPTNFSYIDEIVVNPDLSLFDFQDSDLRSNEDGLPDFSDELSDTGNLYRSEGNFYFSDIDPEDFDGDTNRLVRSNTNPQDVELIYDVDELNHFRIEFWALEERSLADISNITGNIQTFISNDQDIEGDYTEVPLKFVRIKIINEWILYALVPEDEIETEMNFFKITITGGTGSMWGAQYGAVHLYENSLANITLNIEENEFPNSYIYPNPTNGILRFSQNMENKSIKIFNTLGQLVLEDESQQYLNLSHLENGIYFLKIDNQNAIKIVKRD